MLVLVHPEPEVATDDAAQPDRDEATALLSRVATGDQRAFSDLYDLIAPRMLGLVRHVLKDHAQSEEVVQEVLLEVWQTATRFDPNKGKAVTWMLTMAHRRAIDRVRSAQASRDRDTKIGIRDLGREVDTVSESVEISIEHRRVEKAMARLSDLQRQAVELAYYGGYTQSEVAEMLNIPLGTVKTRLRDGLIRLRTELGVAS
jgi:RNA polymerase sigma-70 factor, ECF subfamily